MTCRRCPSLSPITVEQAGGSAAEVAYLARLLSWAAYVDAACGTEERGEWRAP